ncbi:hypothetical protein J2W24_004669 [Variovorax boronicumulans]|nr:hypothetical protein [Variovorax boronicumulans]
MAGVDRLDLYGPFGSTPQQMGTARHQGDSRCASCWPDFVDQHSSVSCISQHIWLRGARRLRPLASIADACAALPSRAVRANPMRAWHGWGRLAVPLSRCCARGACSRAASVRRTGQAMPGFRRSCRYAAKGRSIDCVRIRRMRQVAVRRRRDDADDVLPEGGMDEEAVAAGSGSSAGHPPGYWRALNCVGSSACNQKTSPLAIRNYIFAPVIDSIDNSGP